MALRLATFVGRDIRPVLPNLARLCTTVFREWPHLYDGDGGYDADHLEALAASSQSAIVVVYDGATPVGASTCLPLGAAAANFHVPFQARGWPVDRFFYLAESVLLPPYRGQGIGRAFFAIREAYIRNVSTCDYACFCTIQRPWDHPLRPAAAVPLDTFWRRQGYAPAPGLHCTMRWKELGEAEISDVAMQFWIKPLISSNST